MIHALHASWLHPGAISNLYDGHAFLARRFNLKQIYQQHLGRTGSST